MNTIFKSYQNVKLLIVVICLLCAFGCKKILEVPIPENAITIDAQFRDTASANAAVRGIYVRMTGNSSFEWGGITANAAKSADDIHKITGADAFELNQLTSANKPIDPARDMWRQAYGTINKINACIEGLGRSNGLPPDQKLQLLGECYFDRAFIYFNLVNLWGNATALVLTTDVIANTTAASTTQAVIYQQIIADLVQAEHMMSANYPSPQRARPNVMAAAALLARVYLYTNQYSEAIAESGKVINSGLYTPLPALATNFLKGSNEIIWAFAAPNADFSSTADGQNFLPLFSFVAPPYQLTTGLLGSFEGGDRRSTAWVGTYNAATGQHYTYPRKYKNNYNDQTGTENYIVLRAGEQYLIRAEAYCRINNVTAAVADLNVVRARAFKDPSTGIIPPNAILSAGMTVPACMAAVEHERRVELFAEWGHRWFDLKRWPGLTSNNLTRADEVLPPIKPAWQPGSKLYPISDVEIQLDPNLKQNPGY